ncbi:hypothetical protein AKO1_002983 [Acrasis kona]|uniref:Zn(2)-C6 fungal-type domain-containing protein n=1 Tax=Acrasis kona TaxID=1008807 RepID=A0AAW2Z9H5_9EUKA
MCNMDEMTFNSNLSGVLLSKQSCSNCRRQHKKCDRLLPACGLCTKRKKLCLYEDQNKKKIRQEPDKNFVSPDMNLDQEGSSMTSTILTMLKFNMPVMSKDRVREVVKMVEKEEEDSRGDTTVVSEVPREEFALVCCAYAISTKYNNEAEKSKVYFEKARTLIAPQLDYLVESYVTVACCCFLGTYCALEAEIVRADFYCNLVKMFIDYHSKQRIRDKRLNFVEHDYRSLKALIEQESDLEIMLKKYIERCFTLRDFYGKAPMDEHYQLKDKSSDIWLPQSDVEKIYTDLRNNSNQQFPLNVERLEKFSKILTTIFGGSEPNLPCVTRRWAICTLVLHGAQLQYFQKIGDHKSARREADNITTVILNKKIIFKMVGVLIIAAANIHLEDFASGLEDRGVLIQILQDDYTAVKNISDSSNLWKVRLNNIKTSLEETIWEYTNHQNQLCNQLYATTTSIQQEHQQEEYDIFTCEGCLPTEENRSEGQCLNECEFQELLRTILD